jgi:hypothetical protein
VPGLGRSSPSGRDSEDRTEDEEVERNRVRKIMDVIQAVLED